jgi:RNA polymerase sigma-70 factor (ECF subfamily)
MAAQSGQSGTVAAVLDPSVALLTDSGGNVPADTRAARGSAEVAQRICDLLNLAPTDVEEHNVNGQSALVLRREGRVMGIVSVNVHADLVTDLWLVLNPDKLRHWN